MKGKTINYFTITNHKEGKKKTPQAGRLCCQRESVQQSRGFTTQAMHAMNGKTQQPQQTALPSKYFLDPFNFGGRRYPLARCSQT